MFDLNGRVAFVTGAGQGVGAGIARGLAAAGAAVAVNDLHEDRAKAVVSGIESAGGRAAAIPCDVTDLGAVREAIARTENELGPVDILVNNAGVPPGMGVTKFRDADPALWAGFVDLNVYGVMNASKCVADGMCERGFGRIVTISSGAGQTGLNYGVSAYAAGKGGQIAFMRHLALELAEHGVTANTLALGLMSNTAGTPETEGIARTIPVGRLGTPEDVAAAVRYLASDEAGWMTGQTIGLNGGNLTS